MPTSESGWRAESYHGLEVEVPSSWGYGSMGAWCVDTSEPGPEVVDRPVAIDLTILCNDPGSGYGVIFFDAGTTNFDPAYESGVLVQTVGAPGEETGMLDNPIGSWVGYRSDEAGAVLVVVVARDKSVARRVLDSARTVTDVDSNGCAVRRDGPAPAVERRTVAVCSYDEDGRLTQSELITGKAAAAVSAAVDATPVDDRPVGCAARPGRASSVLLREPEREAQVGYESSCRRAHGVLIGDERRRLTAEVLYWALSPGNRRGSTDDVPMPDQPR